MPYLLFLSIGFLLSGCGGGSSGTRVNVPNSDVDFVSPNLAGKFQLFTSGSATSPVQDIFVQDLNNDSREEVIIAGRQSQSAFGPGGHACNGSLDCKIANWENSQLTLYEFNASNELENRTSSWFSATDSQIIGTEPALKFGDFDGDDTIDIAVGHSTDMEHFGPLIVYKNTGASSFNRENHDIGNKWMHDIAVGDINQDGLDDILVSGYSDITIMLGGNSGFTQLDTSQPGSSGVAIDEHHSDRAVP